MANGFASSEPSNTSRSISRSITLFFIPGRWACHEELLALDGALRAPSPH